MCCVLGYVTPMFGMHAVLFTRMTWPAAQPPPPTPATLRPPDPSPASTGDPPRAPTRSASPLFLVSSSPASGAAAGVDPTLPDHYPRCPRQYY